jgi:hypothetical protein
MKQKSKTKMYCCCDQGNQSLRNLPDLCSTRSTVTWKVILVPCDKWYRSREEDITNDRDDDSAMIGLTTTC